MNKLYKDKEDNFYGWHKKGTEPTTKEYYDEVMLRKEEAYKATTEYKKAECENYLTQTDYMVIREMDNGKKVTDEVKANRERCRKFLHELKNKD